VAHVKMPQGIDACDVAGYTLLNVVCIIHGR